MAEQAGGVALVATLDYGPALAALREFQKAVTEVENSGAQISKLQDDMLRVNARLQENVAAQQASAAEMEVLIQKTNQLTAAQDKEAGEADKANRAQANAMRAQIKDAEYLNKTLEQRQQILARISASLKGQDVSELQPKQAEVLAARYGQLAVTEYAGGGLAQASLAQQRIAEQEALAQQERRMKQAKLADDAQAALLEKQLAADTAAAQIASDQAILAEREEAAVAQKKLTAARIADNQQAALLEKQLAADAATAQIAADQAILAEREEAAVAQKRLNAARLADDAQVVLLEKEIAAGEAAARVTADQAILAERAERVAAEAALAAARLADDEQVALLEKAIYALEVENIKERDRLILAEQAEYLAAQKRAASEQAAVEAARAAEIKRSADYETSTVSSKMKMLKSIAEAEKMSGPLSQNPSVASLFPTSALSDYAMIGAGADAYHKFRMELEAVGKGAASAATGIKATAQEAREVVTIAKDVGTGEWGRFTSSFVRLLTLSGTFDGILGPLGLAIGAVGTGVAILGLAAVKGAEEQNKLNLALAMTGNYAGTTVEGLEQIAHAATSMGGTIGEAKEVVAQLAETGKFTSGQILNIATAVVELGHAGGDTSKVLREFQSLAQDPLTATERSVGALTMALAKLNEQYHFLTDEQYEEVRLLEKSGQTQEAARVATELYAEAVQERAKQVVEAQGWILQGWHAIKEGASAAWDAMMGLGRDVGTSGRIAQLEAQIKGAQATQGGPFAAGPGEAGYVDTDAIKSELASLYEQRRLETADAAKQSEKAQSDAALIAATAWHDRFDQKFWSPAQKRAAEIAEYYKAIDPLRKAGKIDEATIASDIANINAKYHDKAPKRGHIDPTDYEAAKVQATLDADAVKQAQQLLNLRKQIGLYVTDENRQHLLTLQAQAEISAYDAQREKILKDIKNADRNGNPNSKQHLVEELDTLERQHRSKMDNLELDFEAQTVALNMQRALTNIATVEQARTQILTAQDALWGNAASQQDDILTQMYEAVAVQKAQYEQAKQMVALGDSRASQEEIAYARQANTLSLARQLFDIEQQRQKLLMDNAFSLQNVYQQTLNAVDAQISALEKSRTTLADQAVTGFSSGLGKANDSLFQSFKEKKTADAYTLQNFTGNIGGGIYDSITQSLSKELTESTLKGFQGLLKATGAVSIADAAREKAQQDLALNTASMTESLGVTIPDLLRKQLGYMDGTLTPTGPVGNAAVPGGHGALSQADQNAQNGVIGQADFTRATGKPSDISNATSALQTFGKESDSTLSQFGLTASSAASLLYTGVVAATSGSSKAIKNYVIYATAQLLELYAIQKLVGLIGAAAGGAGAAAGEGVQVGAVATPTVTSTPLYADGVASVDKDGYITAPGGPKDDRGLAWLSNGESVLTAAATKYYGADRIARMNKMQLPRFADGRVGAGAGSGVSGGGNVYIDMNFASGGGSSTDGKAGVSDAAQNGQMARDLESAVLKVISKYSQPGGAVYTTIRQIAGRP
jgi:phage-related minor tail protein